MKKDDFCSCSCGNQFIGFCYHEVKGYCRRCKHFFKFGYNSAGNDFDRLRMKCPKCGKADELVESDSHGMDTLVLESLVNSNISMSDKTRQEALEEINEIKRIHKMLDEYK